MSTAISSGIARRSMMLMAYTPADGLGMSFLKSTRACSKESVASNIIALTMPDFEVEYRTMKESRGLILLSAFFSIAR